MMGEMTEDILNGISCSICGMYFIDPKDSSELYEHGYPVVCWDCWNEMNKKNRLNFQRALVSTLCF
jgi:hypothetical protein